MIVSTYSGGSTATDTSSASASTTNSDMGKMEFLTMLVTQIKNQDPLNPMDNQEFTAQMAQFSSLEQLFSVNDNLNMLLTASNASTSAQAISLIGKEVTALGHNVHVKNGVATDVAFDLPESASEVTINIEDENGNIVRTITEENLSSGPHATAWDGKDEYGNQLADGLYSYSVEAKGTEGQTLEVTTYAKGVVTGVSFEDGVAYAHIGDLSFMMSEITEVQDASTGSTAADSSTTTSQGTSTDQGTQTV
ncbi:MAG: flagellar hook assembly protein FlgD [Nitrospinae bacterium]|nr:flagellar hook assembly protein FlgD [Nitrospinota bacterium]